MIGKAEIFAQTTGGAKQAITNAPVQAVAGRGEGVATHSAGTKAGVRRERRDDVGGRFTINPYGALYRLFKMGNFAGGRRLFKAGDQKFGVVFGQVSTSSTHYTLPFSVGSVTALAKLCQENLARAFMMTVLMAVCVAVNGAPVQAGDVCADPQTQTDMNICAGKAFQEADLALNEIYQKALKLLQESGPEKVEDFKQIQRAWVEFRDLNCAYAADVYEGGSMAPLVRSMCMEKLTQQRIEQIPDLFAEWE